MSEWTGFVLACCAVKIATSLTLYEVILKDLPQILLGTWKQGIVSTGLVVFWLKIVEESDPAFKLIQ